MMFFHTAYCAALAVERRTRLDEGTVATTPSESDEVPQRKQSTGWPFLSRNR